MAIEVSKLKEAFERQGAEERARFESRLGRPLADDEWEEVHRRRRRRVWRRARRRALAGVPKRLQDERNLRRFGNVPLHDLGRAILSDDLARRPGSRGREARPRARTVRGGSRRARAPASSSSDDEPSDLVRLGDSAEFRAFVAGLAAKAPEPWRTALLAWGSA